ncbi:MAG: Csp1 family four helix bundle copper storage protein [Myxococcales bacterium]|mgnify:CR=1 FL=1|nr:Csp1 family four helix bundle copper storage protein [Myxococcales bacterium]HRC55608.1 Csp1 family four helix bundle copper storage protein [Kofleriaceae bacterium]
MINRRDVLLLGTSAAAASVTSALVACAEKKKAPAAAEPAGAAAAAPAVAAPAAGTNRHPELAAAAAKCVAAGEICLAHCLESLATGEKMLGDCAKAVQQMLAVCKMIGALGAANSAHLSKAAALCDAVCKDCKDACDKHASMHEECKGCADACGEMLTQVAKVL